MIDSSKFLGLVEREVVAIRENATKEEKDNLSFDRLKVNSSTFCIYGQLTGSCWSSRAAELFTFSTLKESYFLTQKSYTIDDSKVDDKFNFSPLEVYIVSYATEQDQKNIISYIKGEIDDLVIGILGEVKHEVYENY